MVTEYARIKMALMLADLLNAACIIGVLTLVFLLWMAVHETHLRWCRWRDQRRKRG